MPNTVEIIWWITLALALGLTVVAAGFLTAVVRSCKDILVLASRTVPPAEGIARNTSAIAELGAVLKLAPALLSTAAKIDASSEKIAATLEAVEPR